MSEYYYRQMVVPEIKRLSDNKCSLCGSKNYLHVHHLDYKDINKNNLLLLCCGCHKSVHSNGIDKVKKIISLLNNNTKQSDISKMLNIPKNRVFRVKKRLMGVNHG